jgi:hypothetical protein
VFAAFVGSGLRICGNAGSGTGKLSRNGRVGGLTGAVVPHSTGCASGGGAPCASTSDFFDVRTAAAPISAPVLSTVLRSNPSCAPGSCGGCWPSTGS